MKKLFLILALFAATGLVTVSCKKEVYGTGGEIDQKDMFNITDNGESHNFTRLIKRHENGVIGIAVPTSLGSGYALGIADSLNEGIYSLSPEAPVQLTKLEGTGKVVYTQQSGTLTIAIHDRIDHRISGSFSGILVDDMSGNTATITNGQFVSNY